MIQHARPHLGSAHRVRTSTVAVPLSAVSHGVQVSGICLPVTTEPCPTHIGPSSRECGSSDRQSTRVVVVFATNDGHRPLLRPVRFASTSRLARACTGVQFHSYSEVVRIWFDPYAEAVRIGCPRVGRCMPSLPSRAKPSSGAFDPFGRSGAICVLTGAHWRAHWRCHKTIRRTTTTVPSGTHHLLVTTK